MTKLIVIVGATGGQGGSWPAGIDMVQADVNDETSLSRAFKGAHVIFALTDYYEIFFTYDKFRAVKKEFEQGCNIANAASHIPTLERYMWSTLPHTSKLTAGNAVVPHFEAKGQVDDYIRLYLPTPAQKTTFLMFGIFTDNLVMYPEFRPVWIDAAKKWAQFYPSHQNAPYASLGDHKVNTGIFVHGLLNYPDVIGKHVRCSVEQMTIEESMAIWGRASGKGPTPGSTKIISLFPQQYIGIFGKMGEEIASQWIFFEYISKPAAMHPLALLVQSHSNIGQ